MKKYILLIMLLATAGVITACGDTEVQEKEVENVTSANDNAESTEDKAAEPKEEEDAFKEEINKVIVDNESIKATLISVEKIVDPAWDEEKIDVTFEVENKRADTIEVQAREVSADGKMINDNFLFMSTEVSGGKLADAVLTIQNYEGDLPKIEENIEMLLNVFSWDDMEFDEQHPVLIEFK